MSLKRSLLAGCLVFGSAGAVHAQSTPPTAPADLFGVAPRPRADGPAATAFLPDARPKPAPSSWVLDRPKPASGTAAGAEPAPDQVDDGALRYYASQNDLARVSAEIRRIRVKHPEWQPPEDLFTAVGGGEDEQPLWDLFAKHDYAGLKAKVAEIRQNKPEWQPSRDLAAKVQLGETRDELVRASDAKQWGTVVDLASANAALLTCGGIDALWRTAEALVHLGDEVKAAEAYRYVLTACDDPAARLATVQKAGVLLKAPGALDGLLQLARRQPDGRREFESVRLDAVRARVGQAAEAKSEAAPQDVEALAQAFAATRGDADAQLLGWYSYARKALPDAERWFRAAMDAKPSAKSAEGLVLALRDQGRTGEAETLALRYKDADPLNRKQVVELVSADLFAGRPVAPDLMASFAEAVDATRSADGAQAYGWSLYKGGSVATAQAWFRKSVDWQPNEGGVIGLMVTSNKLGQGRDYADLVARYRATYPKVAELETLMRPRPGPARRVAARHGGKATPHQPRDPRDGGWDSGADAIVEVYRSGRYDQAMAMLDARHQSRVEPRGLSIIRGWAQYQKGDWDGAQKTFGSLKSTQVDREAQDGLRVIDEGYHPKLYR